MGGTGGGRALALGLAAGIAWLAGTAWQLQQATLWPPLQAAAIAIAAALAGAACLRRPRRGALLIAVPAIALAAFAGTEWRAALRLADALPPALEGEDIELTGVVARLPQANPAGVRFSFDVEQALHRGQPVRVPALVALGWYRGPDADALLDGPQTDVRAGQRWRFTVRLRQPHGNVNPHGFDYELWLFEQGVRASGYVRSRAGDAAAKLDDAAGHPIERLRQHVRDRIFATVPDAAAAGVIAALAVGDQGAIDRADWELFRITGVAHLMSISGLHVTMFAWLAGLGVGRVWRFSSRAMLWLPAPLAARWGGLIAAAGYALLAGWGVPAQRTVWMIAAVVALRSAGVRWPQPLVLLAAAVVVTLLDPWAMLQPGFWLSFVAVGMLMSSEPVHPSLPGADAVAGWRRRTAAAVGGMLRTQAVATVALTPLTLLFFQQVSLVGVLANLVAIPLVTLLVTPLALLGVLLPLLWLPAAALVSLLLGGLGLLSAAPLATWSAAVAPVWAQAAGLLGGALLVLPLPWRLRWLGVPLMLPLLWPPIERPPEGRFELLALDIGQGTAVIVRTRSHLLVYDTGPQYSREADAGQRVLLPLLRARGENRIDVLMLSHRDIDHVGGAAPLLARVPVAELSSSIADDHPLRAIGAARQTRCASGQRWHWDGVDFEVLHPEPEAHLREARPNALSCVLRVQGAQGSVLLTGDIERAQEAALLERRGAALRSDVLLVPHHGSRTSSTVGFIAAVAPRLAVVQAGYRSRFGHPAPDVVERYQAAGVAIVRSDGCGAWTWAAEGAMRCQRDLAPRYWRHSIGDR